VIGAAFLEREFDIMRTRRRFDLSSLQRRELPYGVWTLADGGQVLFDRDYFPIWQRSAGAAVRVTAWRWIHWVEQNHFFDDDNPPWDDDATKKTCARVLADFVAGKPIDQYWRAHEARRRDLRRIRKMKTTDLIKLVADCGASAADREQATSEMTRRMNSREVSMSFGDGTTALVTNPYAAPAAQP
jgi:hypothetical protein